MSKKRTPFDILGVTPADDMTSIRMAWRSKVRLLHPDRAADKSTATAELAEVNAAFDALQGHIPKRLIKRAFAQEPAGESPAKPKASGAKPNPDVPDQTPLRHARQRQEQRAEPSHSKPVRCMSEDEQALRKRARAGYAQARDIVAAA